MLFTVALCTHNHAARLRQTLLDLQRLEAPKSAWELLIVDNGCTDETPALLAACEWPLNWNVRVAREPRLGLSNARNRAIRSASGEYLVFIDDDETPIPTWLKAYEKLVLAKSPDAFGSRIEVMFADERPAWLADELLGFLGQLDRSRDTIRLSDPRDFFHGGNFGIRKSVCDKIGDFDTDLGRTGSNNTGGEEVDFYRRLLGQGLNVWWTPDATIYHRVQADKLKRSYFRDLHYCQGWIEGTRARAGRPRIPPPYLYGQLARAVAALVRKWRTSGRHATVRAEMNVSYFVGYLFGWVLGDQSRVPRA